ncbi:MAG: hypothetical protein AAFY88_20540, partial [Acidobacteriota bacterium]
MSGSPAAPGPDDDDGPPVGSEVDSDADSGVDAEARAPEASSSSRPLAVVGALALLAVVAAASTFLVTWGRHDPAEPLKGLGLETTTPAPGEPEVVGVSGEPGTSVRGGAAADPPPLDASDPEQLAFLETQPFERLRRVVPPPGDE